MNEENTVEELKSMKPLVLDELLIVDNQSFGVSMSNGYQKIKLSQESEESLLEWLEEKHMRQPSRKEKTFQDRVEELDEDEIYKVRTFIQELENVREDYFTNLCANLDISEDYEDDMNEWLFDFIFNCDDKDIDFWEYLWQHNQVKVRN